MGELSIGGRDASRRHAGHDPPGVGQPGPAPSGARPPTSSTSAGADAGQHVSFGSGIHFCLGAALARLEAQVAMGSVIRRFPDLELAGDPVPNGRITLRGLDSLPVTS